MAKLKLTRTLCTISFLAGMMPVTAQQPARWAVQVSTGLLLGVSDPGFQVQTGITRSFDHFRIGPGLGYDTYLFKSIPVFASATAYLHRNQLGWLLNLDAGYSIPVGGQEDLVWPSAHTGHSKGGLYLNSGLGYGLGIGRQARHQILFMVGYSQKKKSEKVSQVELCIDPPCNMYAEIYRYYTHTWSFRLGWVF